LDLATELAFDGVVFVEQRGDAGDFVFAELAGMGLRVHSSLVTKLAGGLGTDSVQVRERDDRRTVVRDVDTLQTRHALLLRRGTHHDMAPAAADLFET
jgi:hypothetical protein